MGWFIPCSLVFVVFCGMSSAQEAPLAVTPDSAHIYPAFQMHMPTKSGNVPHLNPEEQGPTAPPKIKVDPAQLQREGRELLELSQSLQGDIESVNQGLHPKDTLEKLKRIQKLAKHLRGEIEP